MKGEQCMLDSYCVYHGCNEAIAIFTKKIHEELKNRIKAGIHVSVNDEMLSVKIYRFDNPSWCFMHDGIWNVIIRGETEALIEYIVSCYRKSILSSYFY